MSDNTKKTLSPPAQKIYEYLVFKLSNRGAAQSVSLNDENLSFRARVPMSQIFSAQVELQRTGLVHLEPGLSHTRYELVNEHNYLSGVLPLQPSK